MKMQIAINPRLRPNIGPVPAVLLTLMGIGAIVALIRFIYGIGAISNLSNTYPWGFWISFDIFTGIAISSGAFLLAAAVYIFDLKQFRPLLMPWIRMPLSLRIEMSEKLRSRISKGGRPWAPAGYAKPTRRNSQSGVTAPSARLASARAR